MLVRSPCIFEGALACHPIIGLVVNIQYIRRFGHRKLPSYFSPDVNRLESGWSLTIDPPHREFIFSVFVLPPDATAKAMTSINHFKYPHQGLARLAQTL